MIYNTGKGKLRFTRSKIPPPTTSRYRERAEENKGRTGSRGCDSSVGGRAAKEARLPKGGTRSAPEMNEADKAAAEKAAATERAAEKAATERATAEEATAGENLTNPL